MKESERTASANGTQRRFTKRMVMTLLWCRGFCSTVLPQLRNGILELTAENRSGDFESCGFDIKSGVDESPLQNCYLTLTKKSSVSPFEFGSETFTSNGLSAFSETWLGNWKIRPSLMGVPKTFKAVVKPCSASKV